MSDLPTITLDPKTGKFNVTGDPASPSELEIVVLCEDKSRAFYGDLPTTR